MKPLSLDIKTQNYFEELYWSEGRTLDYIAHHLGKSRSTIQEWFTRYNIPTNVTLIRNFPQLVESEKMDFYLRGYMNYWNRYSYDSSSNKVAWKIVSEYRTSLRRLQAYLRGKAYVSSSLRHYKQTTNILSVYGLRKCKYLTDYFDLDWADELQRLEDVSPWRGPKLDQGEALNLIISFTNGEWQSAASIADVVGYDVRYTSKILGRAVDRGYIERRPINKKKFEYRRLRNI